jgi:hypothetical protein
MPPIELNVSSSVSTSYELYMALPLDLSVSALVEGQATTETKDGIANIILSFETELF